MFKTEEWHGVTVYTLENEQLSVSLCPSLGNNLYRVWDKRMQRDVLRVPDHPDTLKSNPGHYGTPLMLPPNRIRNGMFSYSGQTYRLDINTPNGHHIHGFLRNHPWTFVSHTEIAQTVSVTTAFSTSAFPDVYKQYPHDLIIEMTYELEQASLRQIVKVTNRGDSAAPFGFGVHTWFLIDHEPELWTLQVPVASIWELDDDLMPTGKLLPLAQYEPIVKSSGLSLQGQNLDTVFQVSGQPNTAVLSKKDYEIRYTASSKFKQWVIFTKGEADEIICMEPYTWVTNAPNLDLDPDVTGLRAVKPGETLQLEIDLDIVHKG